MRQFTQRDIVNIPVCIDHFMTDLPMMISQGTQENSKIWNNKLKENYRGKNNFWWDVGYETFKNPEIHVVKQGLGSTSCGWGGIGGAAMTDSYTTTIINRELNIAAVYYNTTLAYVIDMDIASDFDYNNPIAYYNIGRKYDGREIIYKK